VSHEGKYDENRGRQSGGINNGGIRKGPVQQEQRSIKAKDTKAVNEKRQKKTTRRDPGLLTGTAAQLKDRGPARKDTSLGKFPMEREKEGKTKTQKDQTQLRKVGFEKTRKKPSGEGKDARDTGGLEWGHPGKQTRRGGIRRSINSQEGGNQDTGRETEG